MESVEPMTINVRWRALVLVDADRTSMSAAAAKHGCSPKAIATWRKALTEEPELAGHYARETELAVSAFRSDLSATISAALAKIRELIPQATVGDVSVLMDVAFRSGDLLVSADALVPRVTPNAPSHRRTSQPDEEDPAADERDPRH
jgi:hypothetical protein